MSGVCPSSLSKGALQSNELSAVWLKMKHMHSIHNNQVDGDAYELLRR